MPGSKSELTGREKDVLRCLKHCRTSFDIGRTLGISGRTVKFHLGNIFRKLGAENRTQALAAALDMKLID